MNSYALVTLLAPLLAVQSFAQSPQTGGAVARSPLMAESHSVPWVTEVPAVLGLPVLPTNVRQKWELHPDDDLARTILRIQSGK